MFYTPRSLFWSIDSQIQQNWNPQIESKIVSLGIRSNILIEAAIREVGLERLDILDPANASPSLVSRIKAPIKGVARALGLAQAPPELTPEQIEKYKVERLVYAVRKRLGVRREGKSFVIGIWVTTEDAELSMILARSIADKYIELQLRSRQAVAKQATAWIEERLAVLRTELGELETAGVKYRRESLALDGSSLQTVSQQLFELSSNTSGPINLPLSIHG